MEEVMQVDIPLGIVMNEWSSQGVLDAMVELHKNRNKILTNAYQYAPWSRSHNPKRYGVAYSQIIRILRSSDFLCTKSCRLGSLF